MRFVNLVMGADPPIAVWGRWCLLRRFAHGDVQLDLGETSEDW